jgi:hypothetical protein
MLLSNPAWMRGGGRIVLLEPRRLAVRAAAARMAAILGEPVGQTVGYRVRFDAKVSAKTRIEVVTEGVLVQRLQRDPSLEGVAALIFDEFHERSLDADLSLALATVGLYTFNPVAPLACKRPVKTLYDPCAYVASTFSLYRYTTDVRGALQALHQHALRHHLDAGLRARHGGAVHV